MSVRFDYKPFNSTGKEICLFDFSIGYFMYSMETACNINQIIIPNLTYNISDSELNVVGPRGH